MTRSDLDDATDLGDEMAWSATPGEFAARWNATTEEQRTRIIRGIHEDGRRAQRCLEGDHEAGLEQMRLAHQQLAQLIQAVQELGNTYIDHIANDERPLPTQVVADIAAVLTPTLQAWYGDVPQRHLSGLP